MNIPVWQNGQRVIRQILDWLTSGASSSLSNRFIDLTTAGIVKGKLNELSVIPGTNNTLLTPSVTVRTGVAFSASGDRISVGDEITPYNSANPAHTTDDGLGNPIATPRSTGSLNVPLTANSDNYVWINYLQAVDDVFTLHKLTNAKQFYKALDGYYVSVTTVNVPPTSESIFLARVNITGGGAVSTGTIVMTPRVYWKTATTRVGIKTGKTDLTDRTTSYALGEQDLFLDDHVKAVGSGTVTPTNPHGLSAADVGFASTVSVEEHNRQSHSDGLVGPDSLNLAITKVEPGFDFLTISPLSSTSYAIANGFVIDDSSALGLPTVLTFNAATPSGTWYVYVDRVTSTVQKTNVNLIAAPDVDKLLLWTVVWTYPGDGGPTDGDLSTPVDRRKFGSISSKDVQEALIGYMQSKSETYSKGFSLVSYFTSGVDLGSVQYLDFYGVDDYDRVYSLSGSVTLTNGSSAVSGTTSAFTDQLVAGDGITDSNKQFLGVVGSVASDVALSLTSNWAGTTSTGSCLKLTNHVRTEVVYENDPINIGQRRVASTLLTYKLGSLSFSRTTTYSYDGSGNVSSVKTL